MRKYLLIISCTALLGLWGCGGTSVDEEGPGSENPDNPDNPGPDTAFYTYLLENYDSDGNGELSTREADAVTELRLYSERRFKTLSGIEKLRKLTSLICCDGLLQSLDLSKNTALTYVDCGNNKIASLNILGCADLRMLDCSNNLLGSLGTMSNTSLGQLFCAGNTLTSLDLSANTHLYDLDCRDNKSLSDIVLRNTTYRVLEKDNGTQIRYRDLPYGDFMLFLMEEFDADKDNILSDSEMGLVEEINCSGRADDDWEINYLNVFPNLRRLDCSNSGVRMVWVTGCLSLEYLDCSGNWIESSNQMLPDFFDVENCPSLSYLDCHDNRIMNLDVSSHKKLEVLNCMGNGMKTLILPTGIHLLDLKFDPSTVVSYK